MECIDALLWVGSSHHQYRTVQQFETEAELRGCCRQLDSVHGWLRPGASKIFLAHRDGHKGPNRASMFGYFVLHRLEIIVSPIISQKILKLSPQDLWPQKIAAYCEVAETLLRKNVSRNLVKRELKKKLQREHIPRIASGDFSRQPSILPTAEDIADLLKEVVKEVLKEWWDRNKDSRFTSHDITLGEGHRGCSLRKGPGAVYALDSLCAATHDRYHEILGAQTSMMSNVGRKVFLQTLARKQTELWIKWLQGNRSRAWTFPSLMTAYDGPFLIAVEKCHVAWKPTYMPDRRLRGRAKRAGELVLFERPYPVYESSPKASFRGARRIDGDKLIRQIAERKRGKRLTLSVAYCDEEDAVMTKSRGKRQRIVKKGQLAARLGEDLNISRAACLRLLSRLPKLVKEQLGHFGKFKLPGIGTIRIRKGKTQSIKFTAAKAISASSLISNRVERRT